MLFNLFNKKKRFCVSENTNNRMEFWTHFLKDKNINTMAEIGVWKGDFSSHILKNIKNIKTYYMIDPWGGVSKEIWNKPFNISQKKFDLVYNEALSKTSFARDKIKILRQTTSNAVDNIEDEELDCVYIDGDHTLRGITIDLIKIYPKIKYDGYICGDDLSENLFQHGRDFEPTMVFPYVIYFAEAMDLEIDLLPYNQYVIYKRKKNSFKLNNYTNQYKNINLKDNLLLR